MSYDESYRLPVDGSWDVGSDPIDHEYPVDRHSSPVHYLRHSD